MSLVALLLTLTLLTSATVTVAVYLLLFYSSPMDRLRHFVSPVRKERQAATISGPPEETFYQRVLQPITSHWVHTIGRLSPETMKLQAQQKLQEAGYPYGLDVPKFMAMKALLMVGGFLFLIMVSPALGMGALSAVMGLVGAGFGFVIPDFLLGSMATQRSSEISAALPDVLDLLTVSIEAGLGFDGALQKVCEKTKGPLRDEFSHMLQEIQVGKPRREAFRTLAERTSVDDLSSFLTALIQADQLGVSMGKMLRVQSAEIRRKKRQRAEEQAMKISIKMLFPMVIFILPGLFIVILGPAILQIMKNFAGGGGF